MAKEFAVYKGDELLAMGTIEECAKALNVSKDYIYWLTTPTAKRRLASRKNPNQCTVCIPLEDDE